MKLHFLSPKKIIYNGEVESVTIPGSKGSFTVLDKHAPLLTTLQKGTVVYCVKEKDTHKVSIAGGFAEVKDNIVTICIEKEI